MDRLKVLLVTLLVVGTTAKYSPELQVTLNHGGGLSGHFRTSSNGRGILAFTNIPYAEPPIGTLRFADPVKKAPWTGFLPGNKGEIHCPQKQSFSRLNETSGSEDCLYLFVYRPNTENRDLPVMVFIHGGGFTVGAGALPMMEPGFVLDNDVVLVTINYRLGPLGFLTTFDGTLNGNLGLKDQQLALEWVQENIGSFGGNKDKVTIFGVSAGGASVGMHLFSPKSQPLFQQAIMQSGTPYDSWVFLPKSIATKNAEKLIATVGCNNLNTDELLVCLQKADLETMLVAANVFYEWDLDPLTPFGPVLEMDNSPHPFIQKKDLETIPDVPLIIGVAQDEGAFKSAMIHQRLDLISDLEARFDEIIPSTLCYSHLDKDAKEKITAEIKQFYLNDTKGAFNWNSGKFQYTAIVSDGLFVAGFDKFLQQRLAQKGNAPTFVYQFNYRGTSSFTDLMNQSEEDINWGVSHGDDLTFIFPLVKVLAPHRIMSEEDLQFGRDYFRMWAEFATNGNPLSAGDVKWGSAIEDRQVFLRIGNCNRLECPVNEKTKLGLLEGMFAERIQLWRRLMVEFEAPEKENI